MVLKLTTNYAYYMNSISLLNILALHDRASADQCKSLVKFFKHWTIEEAYQQLTSSLERVVQTGDLPSLRRACIRKIKGIGSNISRKLIPQIDSTSSVNGLLDLLTKSEYWNWFDTRLLEAVTHASGSPEAIKSLDKYKKKYYRTKVSDLALYNVDIKPLKNCISLVEKYKKDPNKLTISDLQKHQYELEQVLGGGLAILTIKTGCVEITWQVPQELVYQVYTSMKSKHDQLSSLAVKSLVCEEADEYAGLPFLWRGQEVGEVGPIEPLPEHVRQEPYSLPQGFQWVTLGSSDAEEVDYLIHKVDPNAKHSIAAVLFFSMHPHAKSEWQFGIRTPNGKLVCVVLAEPRHIVIGGISVMCVCPAINFYAKYKNKRMLFICSKELQRRTNQSNINQFLYKRSIGFCKPVATITTRLYQFSHPSSHQLPISPTTPGWRRMTSKDVPSALALVNKYSSQFEIRQVFTSEEEFSHYFLCPAVPNYMFTYVVENENGNITDLVRCIITYDGKPVARINPVISTVTPVKQLISDVMVCARNNGAINMIIQQYNIKSEVLSSLSLQPVGVLSLNCHLYNYKYHEVPESNFFVM